MGLKAQQLLPTLSEGPAVHRAHVGEVVEAHDARGERRDVRGEEGRREDGDVALVAEEHVVERDAEGALDVGVRALRRHEDAVGRGHDAREAGVGEPLDDARGLRGGGAEALVDLVLRQELLEVGRGGVGDAHDGRVELRLVPEVEADDDGRGRVGRRDAEVDDLRRERRDRVGAGHEAAGERAANGRERENEGKRQKKREKLHARRRTASPLIGVMGGQPPRREYSCEPHSFARGGSACNGPVRLPDARRDLAP
jgi:hypothetical protein